MPDSPHESFIGQQSLRWRRVQCSKISYNYPAQYVCIYIYIFMCSSVGRSWRRQSRDAPKMGARSMQQTPTGNLNTKTTVSDMVLNTTQNRRRRCPRSLSKSHKISGNCVSACGRCLCLRVLHNSIGLCDSSLRSESSSHYCATQT